MEENINQRSEEELDSLNYYFLLKLSLDKELPYSEIEKIIQNFSNSISSSSSSQTVDGRRKIALIEDMKSVFSDTRKRYLELERAKRIRSKNVEDVFGVVLEKGFFSDVDLKFIARAFKLTPNDPIIKELEKKASRMKYVEYYKDIPKEFSYFENIHKDLQGLPRKKYKNIYDFLASFNGQEIDRNTINENSKVVNLQLRVQGIIDKFSTDSSKIDIVHICGLINTNVLCSMEKDPMKSMARKNLYDQFLSVSDLDENISKYQVTKKIPLKIFNNFIEGISYKINKDLAINFGNITCANYNITIEYPKQMDVFKCHVCGTYYTDAGKVSNCPNSMCGVSVSWECPKCQHKNPKGEVNCKSCGTTVAAYEKFEKLFSESIRSLDGLNLEKALEFIKEADKIYNDVEKIKVAKNKIEKMMTQVTFLTNEITNLINEKYIYKANEKLNELRVIDKFIAQHLDKEILKKIADVEYLILQVRTSTTDSKRLQLISKINAICVDSQFAIDYINNFNLNPIDNLSVTYEENSVIVKWNYENKKDLDSYSFVVIRKAGSAPLSVYDGEKMDEIVDQTTFVDKRASSATPYVYAVAVKINSIYSKLVSSTPIVIYQSVLSVSCDASQKFFKFTIRTPNNATNISIYKSEFSKKSEEVFLKKIKSKGRINYFVDEDLELDATYKYKFICEYEYQGKIEKSNPYITIQKRNNIPFTPVNVVYNKDSDDTYEMIAEELEFGEYRLFYSLNVIEYSREILDIIEIPSEMTEVQLEENKFTLPNVPVVFLYPAMQYNDSIAFGEMSSLTKINPFEVKSYIYENKKITIFGKWPDFCDRVTCLYTINNVLQTVHISKEQFKRQLNKIELFNINDVVKNISIFADKKINEIFYSGLPVQLEIKQKKVIHCKFNLSKKSKKHNISVKIKHNELNYVGGIIKIIANADFTPFDFHNGQLIKQIEIKSSDFSEEVLTDITPEDIPYLYAYIDDLNVVLDVDLTELLYERK